MFNEDFLHYLWKQKLLKPSAIETISGEPVAIQSTGVHNHDAGPDFLNAKLKIGNTLWAGNVEIHLKTSDWFRHNHQNDDAYKNVILHVVYEHDAELDIPTVELKGKIPKTVIRQYELLMNSIHTIPCQSQIASVDKFVLNQQLTRAALERIETKAKNINELLEATTYDWDQVFYSLVLRTLGSPVNKETFEELGNRLPFKLIRKYSHDLVMLETLFLGIAGFLDDIFENPVELEMQKDFQHFELKHDLNKLSAVNWKFSKMRPANFPTVRLGQAAALFNSITVSFENLIKNYSVQDIYKLLNVSASAYWDNRYRVGTISSKTVKKQLGKSSIESIIINVIAPLCYAYGQHKGNQALIEKSSELLEVLKPETNKYTKYFNELGLRSASALESQGIIQQMKTYCATKKCLSCAIGNALLRS
ncbi:MAG: DUF2851 family protein [Bacteroidetes bacterium]|nr:DUF2851 family protein [Bacteroidota bacterium]